MSRIIAVIKQEFFVTFQRASYLIMSFGIPVLAVVVLIIVGLIQGRNKDPIGTNSDLPQQPNLAIEGFIDYSGLIKIIPGDLPPDHLLVFDDEIAAQTALETGNISAYYVIPVDYIEKGEFYYVFPEEKSLLDDGQSWVMRWTLMVNLMGGELEQADRIWNTIWNFEETNISASQAQQSAGGDDCSRPGGACQSNELIRLLPAFMVVLFFFSFSSSSNGLFSSIATEKENRTMEVVLLSIDAEQMLAGKTIALGLSGIIQLVVWLASIYIIFTMGGATLNLPENFIFPGDVLIWSLGYFLGGFAVYASLMAGAGALVPKMKEAGAASFIAMLPLLMGYLIGIFSSFTGETNGLVPLIFSFFPLTSPVVMIMRLTVGAVPLWQLLVSLVLLFISAYFILRAVAVMFRAQYLLSGQPFSVRRYFSALLGRGA